LTAAVRDWGLPAYRADQILHWVYGMLTTDPHQMANISLEDRKTVDDRVSFETATIASQVVSKDRTLKMLLRWPDGAMAETVMIPDGPRRTACVSSQVGCPMQCKFCASGMAGLEANLAVRQMVEQILLLDRNMQASGRRITNVVFMGMGEPLANYANLMASLRILHDPKCFNIGARRITISTVGVPAKIRSLAEEDLPVNLALSLHAPNEELRRELIPWAEHFALDEILESLRHYFRRTGREITFEYILLAGVNDHRDHARQLAQLCRTLRVNVNLIVYNEVPGLPFRRPADQDVLRFEENLRSHGVNTHVRRSRGRDIDAACGQLRRRFTTGVGSVS